MAEDDIPRNNPFEDMMQQIYTNQRQQFGNNVFPWTNQPMFVPPIPQGQYTTPNMPPINTVDEIYKLRDRVAELELKVMQLVTILNYITGVKDGKRDDLLQEGGDKL